MTKKTNALRVLVVDDNKDAADSLSRLVQLWGHVVRTAYDESAVQIATEFQPEAVLLDIGMPRMDGTHMVRHIRQQSQSKDVLIIAVTGFHDETIRKLSREAGFDHYLVKPVDLSVLEKLLGMKTVDKQQRPTALGTQEGLVN